MGWFKSESGGMLGDAPLDIIESAIKDVKKSYNSDWDRDATLEEVRDAFNYVMRPLEG